MMIELEEWAECKMQRRRQRGSGYAALGSGPSPAARHLEVSPRRPRQLRLDCLTSFLNCIFVCSCPNLVTRKIPEVTTRNTEGVHHWI